MGCLPCIATSFQAVIRRESRRSRPGNLITEETPPNLGVQTSKSSEFEPEAHQFLRRQTTATTTSSFNPVSERNRRYNNESLSSLAKYTGTRKARLSSTNDSLSSSRRSLRGQIRRRRTGSSGEMPSPNGEIRGRRRGACRDDGFRNDIKKAMVLQDHSDLQFVPAGALNALFRQTSVTKILEGHKEKFEESISSLQKFVCNKATRVFAILVWTNSEPLIEQFFRHGFIDEQLPVRLVINEDFVDAISFRQGEININRHPFNNDEWTDLNIEAFRDNYQWPFLSPVFEESQFRYNFHERTRMPFVDERRRSQKESYFSVVEEWRLHRDHIRAPSLVRIPDDPQQHPTVAIKKLKQMALTDAEFEIVAETEVHALETIRNLNHSHLVKAVAYYTKGKSHCIVFPWARRGNLRNVWGTDPPKLDGIFLEWVFTQLCGLAEAIKTLHHSHKDKSLRHGDLKPENILCFDDTNREQNNAIHSCILVIADVGLSRTHEKLTEFRKGATRTKSGTIMYEPPETELQPDEPRSRRYDVWSLGCIYLEFMIWLLYGREEIEHFRDDLNTLGENTRFYIIEEDPMTRKRTARLNGAVQKWVDWMKRDERCPESTAMRRLLDLIVKRLLIADVGPAARFQSRRTTTFIENYETHSTPSVIVRQPTFDVGLSNHHNAQSRATAEELEDELKLILEYAVSTSEDRIEWLNWNARAQQGPRRFGQRLDASDSVRGLQDEYRFTPLNDDWKYAPDIEMAHNVLNNVESETAALHESHVSQLCERCSHLPIWLSRHTFSDTLSNLKMRSTRCDLCRLLGKHIQGHTEGDHEVVQFFRVGSSLTFHDRQTSPIISLYVSPGRPPLEPLKDLQLGFPCLREPGSLGHLKVLSGWIEGCDNHHLCIKKSASFLPTRVLEIGEDSDTVRLFCGARGQTRPGKYLALSHRWGSSSNHEGYFRTCKSNIAQHQEGMDVSKFPKTFRDAIGITQALGIPYLWIDSLCIVQDDQEDWELESRLMEQVYSNAYVTIAASCATGTQDGFLKPRPPRDCVKVKKDAATIVYLCDAIDDFTRDVESGQLNRRGWVLQERALSRRTIYFADKQTYWECGHGVRCETLTKMNNKKASFLGDASFPDSIETYVKGTRIELFQHLYERYSTLDLSYPADRPIAIKGLERRLIRTLRTEGGYGVFDIFFHRCLLWQRSGSSIQRIDTLRNEITPSWSWMAYEGGIKYMNVPFGEVSWAEDICSPWNGVQSGLGKGEVSGIPQVPSNIKALAWELTSSCKPANLILDDPSRSCTRPLQYVIVGTDKSKGPGNMHRKVYGLIVAETAERGLSVFERVGVAILEESLVWRSKPATAIQLV